MANNLIRRRLAIPLVLAAVMLLTDCSGTSSNTVQRSDWPPQDGTPLYYCGGSYGQTNPCSTSDSQQLPPIQQPPPDASEPPVIAPETKPSRDQNRNRDRGVAAALGSPPRSSTPTEHPTGTVSGCGWWRLCNLWN
jgi:hypothetical protein